MSNSCIAVRNPVLPIFAQKYVTLSNDVTWAIGFTTTVFSKMEDFTKRHAMNTIMKFESP